MQIYDCTGIIKIQISVVISYENSPPSPMELCGSSAYIENVVHFAFVFSLLISPFLHVYRAGVLSLLLTLLFI